MIGKFASSETTSERTLLMCYRKMLFFLVNPKSLVVSNAKLCAERMCQPKGILTKDLYIWYKEQILFTVIPLAVSVYMEYGLLLDKTLANVMNRVDHTINFLFFMLLLLFSHFFFQFNEMLGYTHLKRDLMKSDFAIITAMILPYALQVKTFFVCTIGSHGRNPFCLPPCNFKNIYSFYFHYINVELKFYCRKFH